MDVCQSVATVFLHGGRLRLLQVLSFLCSPGQLLGCGLVGEGMLWLDSVLSSIDID